METPPIPPVPPAARRGWFARHWKWLVPALALLLAAAIAVFVFGVMSLVTGSMRSSVPYQQALERARAHPDVVAALGEPVAAGWWVSGSIAASGSGGRAELRIPVSGARGRGDLFVEADRKAGAWTFETLVFQTADGRRIALDDAPPAP